MSGGVDSSVAALLLAREGYEVFGFTAKLLDDEDEGTCCYAEAVARARRACDLIEAEHVAVNLEEAFREKVIRRFVDEYRAGRTPNPCIDCNRFVKFDEFLRVADWLDCQFLATGHYARIGIRPRETFGPVDKRVGDSPSDWRRRTKDLLQLMRGVDRDKEQSYFVAVITREQLARLMFPCGDLTKDQVRELAREAKLPTYEAPESQDACFLTAGRDVDYWVERISGEKPQPGVIRDVNGKALGEHEGIEHFTRGQRKGLKLGGGPAKYVVDIDADTRDVVVGEPGSAPVSTLKLAEVNILAGGYTNNGRRLTVKTRYRQREVPATLDTLEGGGLLVRYESAQEHISPGQWCVFYDGEVVVGCGMIDSVSAER
jgi:tRNA-specific 2-thiouridylase